MNSRLPADAPTTSTPDAATLVHAPHEQSLEQAAGMAHVCSHAQAGGAGCGHAQAGACGHASHGDAAQAHQHGDAGCAHQHGDAGCAHEHGDAAGGCGHAEGAHACAHAHACGHAPAAETPADARPVYELLGGEPAVRGLVDRFYDLMDLDEEFRGLRALHPASLDGSRDKLFWFLSGWMGGPNLFAQKVGAPMLRARHLPYAIGNSERDQWLICMGRAMVEVGIEEPLFDRLLRAFYETADWMRNREG